MGVAEILGGIDLLFSLIFRLYNWMEQVAGDQPIPTIEEIMEKNRKLQAEIDAAK